MPRKLRPHNLPEGWDVADDFDGKQYYIDHSVKATTWLDPRDLHSKPHSFADCVGDELPYGWEECYSTAIGTYYVNHIQKYNQLEDPRVEWQEQQNAMVNEYLATATRDVQNQEQQHWLQRDHQSNSAANFSSNGQHVSAAYSDQILNAAEVRSLLQSDSGFLASESDQILNCPEGAAAPPIGPSPIEDVACYMGTLAVTDSSGNFFLGAGGSSGQLSACSRMTGSGKTLNSGPTSVQPNGSGFLQIVGSNNRVYDSESNEWKPSVSTVSVCSSGSANSNKIYDTDQLTADVILAKQRVRRLKRELEEMKEPPHQNNIMVSVNPTEDSHTSSTLKRWHSS